MREKAMGCFGGKNDVRCPRPGGRHGKMNVNMAFGSGLWPQGSVCRKRTEEEGEERREGGREEREKGEREEEKELPGREEREDRS